MNDAKMPNILVPIRVLESVRCLSDSAKLTLFKNMSEFALSGEVMGFENVNDPKERATLELAFGEFMDEVGKGLKAYNEKQASGRKGQLKRTFTSTLEFGSERDFERLWMACGCDPERARAKIEEIASGSLAGSSGSRLKAPSYA